MRWVLMGVVAMLWMAFGALALNVVRLPPAWNPWARLVIDAEPNLLTGFKLSRLSADAPACRAALAEAGVRFTAVPDRDTGPGCGFDNVVRIEDVGARLEPALPLSCRAAVALTLWERHVVAPAAQASLGASVSRIEHYGSYACRNVYGRADARRSQHASADAIDVAGFVLDDGRRIRVAADWGRGGAAADFLRASHDGACAFFDGVLGPAYNAAHHDHFHLDRGTWRTCR